MHQTPVLWIVSELSQIDKQSLGQMEGVALEFLRDPQELGNFRALLPHAIVVLELPQGEMAAAEVVGMIRALSADVPILMHELEHTGRNAPSGAWGQDVYCIFGPASAEAFRLMIQSLAESRRTLQLSHLAERTRQPEREPWREMLIGESIAMQRVVDLIRLIGPRRSTVLITGESGTGKEVVARAIHLASARASKSMVAVNCSALPETLLEAELFGHSKGAFTGALTQRAGRFEQANDSTILLDEIGDLPLEMQGKLLRVLQERELQRVGSSETIHVDVRIIAATNVDLDSAVKAKRFREDLFYRLMVVLIHLPPLRQRIDDIPLLVRHFIAKICKKEGLPLKSITQAALARLAAYSWPGNVRQLEHAVETAIVLSGDQMVLGPGDFSLSDRPLRESAEAAITVPDEGVDYEALMCRIQRHLLAEALNRSGGNKSRAAGMLRMKRSTLVSKVKALSDDEPLYLS